MSPAQSLDCPFHLERPAERAINKTQISRTRARSNYFTFQGMLNTIWAHYYVVLCSAFRTAHFAFPLVLRRVIGRRIAIEPAMPKSLR